MWLHFQTPDRNENHVLFLQTFLRREGSGEAHYSGRRETEKGLRFVLAELGFLAGFLAVGRCPGRKSVDCAKLAVIRRSQEAQLDEDKGFKMKLDSVIHLNRLCKGIFLGSYFCSFLFTVRPSVCTDNSKMFFFLSFGNYNYMLCPTHCMLFHTEGCVQQVWHKNKCRRTKAVKSLFCFVFKLESHKPSPFHTTVYVSHIVILFSCWHY